MKLGQQAMEALKAQIDGSLKQGDDLVVAGVIGIRGTQLLMRKRERNTASVFFRRISLEYSPHSGEMQCIQQIFRKYLKARFMQDMTLVWEES